MNINWKKSAIVLTDVLLAIYLLLAVTAFNEPDDQKAVCTRVDIRIEGGMTDGFLGDNEVESQLKRAKLFPQGQPMAQINTRSIEETLLRNPFVKEAQCYKTQGGKVVVMLTQRFPVMRIKADNGDDYYIDEQGNVMPRSHYISDLAIATGHITRKYARNVLAPIGDKLLRNRFWHNQIEQINVLHDATIEIVPRVGNHIVYLGLPVNIDQKLARLEKFYRYGLNVAGWNKYSYINLEFDNQIICKKKEVSNQ